MRLGTTFCHGSSGRGEDCLSAAKAASLTLLLTLAACGGTGAPTATQPAQTPASAATKPSAPASNGAASGSTKPAAPAKPAASASAEPAPSGVTPINVAFAAQAAVYDPWYIAMKKGYDVEEGVKIQMIQAGGGVSTPALISNKLDYSTSAASAFSAVLKGAPLKIIFTNADKPQYRLYSTSKDVKTLADLKGKSVAVQSRGDTFEIATRIELLKNGIDPNSISYTPLGTGGALLAAFKGGSVAASLLNTADIAELGDAVNKGNLLADLQRDVSMLYMGIATNDDKLQRDRDQVLRFTRATVKGREYMKAFRDQAIDILTAYNKRERAANAEDYDQTIPLLTDDGTLTPDAQQFNAAVSAQILNMQKSQIPPIDKMYDYSLAKQAYAELTSSGWKPTP